MPASPPLTADLLIADFEALRLRLRIGSWVQLPDAELLLHGQDDLVAAPAVIAEFEQTLPGAAMRTFPSSGHFGYLEETADYCATVTEFVLATAG